MKELSTSSAPSFASCSAMPSPIPEFDPVTTATLPFSDIFLLRPRWGAALSQVEGTGPGATQMSTLPGAL